MASPLFVERQGEMTRLLNEVDKLSDRLHTEFPTITEEDYRLFGSELRIVINTLKDLRKDSLTRSELKLYANRMREQIVDLEELDHDIRTFRVEAPKNKELQATLAQLDITDGETNRLVKEFFAEFEKDTLVAHDINDNLKEK